MKKQAVRFGSHLKKAIPICLAGILLVSAGVGIGFHLQPHTDTEQAGYAANPAHEYLAGSAAWQMSAEAHALMMQSFHIAERNITDLASWADQQMNGYHWIVENGQRKLYRNEKRVCVVSDIDDTLVDGVHYTANILGKDGEWTNKAFTDFIQSEGCTALPGAVEFANFCVDNGIALFYVTNRYDQGYKTSEAGYANQEGYQKADGTIIGSSTHELFGQTMYDITMASMAALGFPINIPEAPNYCEDACLIVNDTKLNGSSKETIRQSIASGGTLNTGERIHESDTYPGTVDLGEHHIAMLLGDDLNDISQIFSDSENAVDRVKLAVENMEKWGCEWIVFPNAVYGSSLNYAMAYGFPELFDYYDYTKQDNTAWALYKNQP